MKEHYSAKNKHGIEYWLYSKLVTLRGGKQQRIYYFNHDPHLASSTTGRAEPSIPKGLHLRENPRNGMLTLVRTDDTSDFDEED